MSTEEPVEEEPVEEPAAEEEPTEPTDEEPVEDSPPDPAAIPVELPNPEPYTSQQEVTRWP